MESTHSSGSTPTRATVVAIAAVTVGLVAAGLAVGPAPAPRMPPGARAMPRVPGPPQDVRSLFRQLGIGSITWYSAALATPLIWWIAVRWPLMQGRGVQSLVRQAVAIIVLIAGVSLAQYVVTYRLSPGAPSIMSFAPVALARNLIPLLAIAAVVNALEIRRRAVRGAIESERLRAELAESRLMAVTSQLQPHFLFNTLQSISTLIHRDPAAADAMLAKLSDLLRDVLRRSRTALVPLSEEIRMTTTYLDLARVRYGDRLQVAMEVDDRALGAQVPMLLLQPFVENAIQHGIGPRAAGGTVGVRVRREAERLLVSVWDDGVGLDAAWVEGTGVANARERLRHAYGDDQSIAITSRDEGGAVVTMALPVVTVRQAAGPP